MQRNYSYNPKKTMVKASTENQVAAENGGDGCKSTAFELEALIDSSGVSFHQTAGVLHILLNRVSKWCVLLSYSGLILLRHDDVALWAVLLWAVLGWIWNAQRLKLDIRT